MNGKNENGKIIIELCVRKEIMTGNILFKKDIHEYTWMRQDNVRKVD